MIVCTETVLIGRKCDPMEERIKHIFSHQGIRYVKGSLRKGHTSRDAGGGVLRYGLPEGAY